MPSGGGISIHPPLAGRDRCARSSAQTVTISIHPPLAGRDYSSVTLGSPFFISIHPPLAGRDLDTCRPLQIEEISIHPPLAGRDSGASYGSPWRGDFNPPAPCGAGPVPLSSYTPPLLFQSTRPLRGGTAILHKKTVQNIAYCTKSAFTLAVLSGFPALMRPFFCQTCTNFGANLPKNRCSLPVRTLIPSGPPPADSRH